MNNFPDFQTAIRTVEQDMLNDGIKIHPQYWQSIDVGKRAEAQMAELLFVNFVVPIPLTKLELTTQISPNMPWAEDHFQERVAGEPVNPGKTWINWPWSNSADTHRILGKFNHNYMERYWPKYAGDTIDLHKGIRYSYGDLGDVLRQIAADPLTRQAYLPVFFPEDTGAVHKGRVPCSIGYHFLIRDNKLNLVYHIRSCDLWRHFRDDLYLTARLGQWMIEKLSIDYGLNFTPGNLHVHISSLHLFINDYRLLAKRLGEGK
jgi:thymidylate synthase